jgi:antitoxin component HigA of HigAB toxin-antitoxin module
MKRHNEVARLDFSDLWDDEGSEYDAWLSHKREDVGITLTGMLHAFSMSRADLARQLDWKPSRVTRALSGRENLTINSIAEIVHAVGLDFDLVLRERAQARGLHCWEDADHSETLMAKVTTLLDEVTVMHTETAAMRNTYSALLKATFRKGAAKSDTSNSEGRGFETEFEYTLEDDYESIANQA